MPALPRSRRWTLTELTTLSHLAMAGAAAEEIATALDRTVEAVRIKAAHQRIVLPLSGRQQPRVLESVQPRVLESVPPLRLRIED